METRINIPKPCTENWETMRIGLHSRFCDNCQKNVIDFTNKDRMQILEYLLANYDKKVCGHIYSHQLDFSHTDFLVTINALTKKSNNSNLSFYLLTLGTLILASCDNQKTSNKSENIDTIVTSKTEIGLDTITAQQFIDTLKNSATKQKKDDIEIIELDGEIVVYPDSTYGHTEPYLYVDIMPEFKGGIDSLMSFIKQNLTYPDWERENKIQGRVFATFVIDNNGKIKDVKILKTVQGSKNFDKEVLRVINSMPDWTPGQQEGKNVDVQFTLPIDFKL